MRSESNPQRPQRPSRQAFTARRVLHRLRRRLHRIVPVPVLPRRLARVLRSRRFAMLVAAGTALSLHGTVRNAKLDRDRWGTVEPAVASSRSIRAGAKITADDLVAIGLPPLATPVDALRSVESAVGTTARITISEGQVIADSLLDRQRASPAELAIGRGRVGVSVETGPGRPKLAAGNIVIVIPTPGTAPTVDSVTGDGVTDVGVEGVEGVEGVVVAVDDDYVTLSVVVADARALAAMIATGPLVVAMKGR